MYRHTEQFNNGRFGSLIGIARVRIMVCGAHIKPKLFGKKDNMLNKANLPRNPKLMPRLLSFSCYESLRMFNVVNVTYLLTER